MNERPCALLAYISAAFDPQPPWPNDIGKERTMRTTGNQKHRLRQNDRCRRSHPSFRSPGFPIRSDAAMPQAPVWHFCNFPLDSSRTLR
jgi:hypothetical protein